MRWEYKVIHVRGGKLEGRFGKGSLEQELNALGADGWDLVAVYENRMFFKRAAP
jgi:hypothetical protein